MLGLQEYLTTLNLHISNILKYLIQLKYFTVSLRRDNSFTSKQEKCVTYWKYLDPFIEPDLDLLSEADLDLRRDTDLDLRGDADLDLKIKTF